MRLGGLNLLILLLLGVAVGMRGGIGTEIEIETTTSIGALGIAQQPTAAMPAQGTKNMKESGLLGGGNGDENGSGRGI